MHTGNLWTGTGWIKMVSEREESGMYTGQIMMFAGIAMIAFSVIMMIVLTVVFGKNKKKLIKKVYGEIEERDNG